MILDPYYHGCFKCLTIFDCDDLNKKDTVVSVDLINACETLRKELLKSMKNSKKFKEELKSANLEREELVVWLDESNKKNEFLRNQISSHDEKMKSLEQELVESKNNFKIWLVPSLLLLTEVFLFLLSLKLKKFISLFSREIIKKRIILID